MFKLSMQHLEYGKNWRNSRADNQVPVDQFSLIFELDLYFIWSLLFPKFETDRIIFVWVIVCNTLKIWKIREIQGQITQFRLSDFAHIRTWPDFPRDLPIYKVWSRSDKICLSYRCNTKIVYAGRTTDNLPWHKLFGLWPVELKNEKKNCNKWNYTFFFFFLLS